MNLSSNNILILDESLDDVYSRYYIQKLDKDEFDNIIRIDPTFDPNQDKLGIYGKWLLNLAIKKGFANIESNSSEFIDQLQIFDAHKRTYDAGDRDIGKCKSLDDLIELNHKYDAEEATPEMIKASSVPGLNIIGNTSNWEVYNPTTHAAAKYIRGNNAVWCTGRAGDASFFNNYNQNSDLLVFINKRNRDEKYQAAVYRSSFSIREFADAKNNHIEFYDFLIANDDLQRLLQRSAYSGIIDAYHRYLAEQQFKAENTQAIIAQISNGILNITPDFISFIKSIESEASNNQYKAAYTRIGMTDKISAIRMSSIDTSVITFVENFLQLNYYGSQISIEIYIEDESFELLDSIVNFLRKFKKIYFKKNARIRAKKWHVSVLKPQINWY